MIRIFDKVDCCGCSACEQSCPVHCIDLCQDDEGFRYPVIDINLCIECGKCLQVCPILNNSKESSGLSKAYAALNKNEEQRLASSSGGVFTILAEQVLDENGFVFGAAFTEDSRSVRHISCDSTIGLGMLRGSKYLQSDKQGSYREVREELSNGRLVLFSGTPCEIEGLKRYLGKPYANLICIDIICHGVPSPKLWEKYVCYRENEAGASTLKTFFRHKHYGWKKYSVLFEFSNNTEYLGPLNKDLYMKMFLQNLCLRPSCYECNFKKMNRESDITLADFWGGQNIVPEMDDDKGLSLLIVHSNAGESLLNRVQDKLLMKAVDLDVALEGNSMMTKSVDKPVSRDMFMRELDDLEIPALADKYLRKYSFGEKVFRLIKRTILRNVKTLLRKTKYNNS